MVSNNVEGVDDFNKWFQIQMCFEKLNRQEIIHESLHKVINICYIIFLD